MAVYAVSRHAFGSSPLIATALTRRLETATKAAHLKHLSAAVAPFADEPGRELPTSGPIRVNTPYMFTSGEVDARVPILRKWIHFIKDSGAETSVRLAHIFMS
jgi:hypothetical protein